MVKSCDGEPRDLAQPSQRLTWENQHRKGWLSVRLKSILFQPGRAGDHAKTGAMPPSPLSYHWLPLKDTTVQIFRGVHH